MGILILLSFILTIAPVEYHGLHPPMGTIMSILFMFFISIQY